MANSVSRPEAGATPGVRSLMIVNVLGYLLVLAIPEMGDRLALLPGLMRHGSGSWRLVTSLGVHFSLLHLAVDLATLWLWGRLLESFWGARRLLTYYFICGVGGNVFVLLFDWHGVGAVGATSAAMGSIAALAWIFPDAIFLFFSVLRLRARHAALLLVALHLGLSWQGCVWNGQLDTVALLAQSGGVVSGYLYYRHGWLTMVWLHKLSQTLRGQPVAPRSLSAAGPLLVHASTETGVNQHRLDAILDKIAQEGMQGLTVEERQWLDQASRKLAGNWPPPDLGT